MLIIIVVWKLKMMKKSVDISNIFTKIYVQKNGSTNGTMKWIVVFFLVFIVRDKIEYFLSISLFHFCLHRSYPLIPHFLFCYFPRVPFFQEEKKQQQLEKLIT